MNCVCAVSRAYSIHRANRVGEKGHRRTLLPLWGNSPVVQEPLQGDTRSLSGGLRGFDGARRMRPVQVSSEVGTGETEATLADCGRFRKLLTCRQGWFPNPDAGNDPGQHIGKLPGMGHVRQWGHAASECARLMDVSKMIRKLADLIRFLVFFAKKLADLIQNRLSGIFVLPDFRGYYYIADCPLWPQRASCEVVFEVDALKMPVFEEILTNSGA